MRWSVRATTVRSETAARWLIGREVVVERMCVGRDIALSDTGDKYVQGYGQRW